MNKRIISIALASLMLAPMVGVAQKKSQPTMKDVIHRAFAEENTAIRMCNFIKSKLQEKEEGKWNVIIGKDFSTDIVHKSRRYGLFKVGELSILVWQSGSTTL